MQADVVVIGGGPAGSTVSALIAQRGHRVTLFERERFPRFHIGESLIPETYWVLKRLNMLPKMQQSHFVKKYSVQFINEHGRISEPFYFVEHKPHESSQTWQVLRSELDQMLLDNAVSWSPSGGRVEVSVRDGAVTVTVASAHAPSLVARMTAMPAANPRTVPSLSIVATSGCMLVHATERPDRAIRDLTGGFKCFNRRVLESIDLESVHANGYGFQIELTYRALRAGFSVKEVPILFRERRAGRSKMTARIALEAVWKVPALALRGRQAPTPR